MEQPTLSLLPLQSTYLKIDWINTGHYKNLNTIGKQNYQEHGVEAELNFEFFESYHFYRAMHFSAKRGIAIACRLSVCLSVCL